MAPLHLFFTNKEKIDRTGCSYCWIFPLMVAMDKKRMKGNEPCSMDQALNHYDIKITEPAVLCMQHSVSEKYQHMSTAIGDEGYSMRILNEYRDSANSLPVAARSVNKVHNLSPGRMYLSNRS